MEHGAYFSEVKPVHKEDRGREVQDMALEMPPLLVSVRYLLFTLLSPEVFKLPALMRHVEDPRRTNTQQCSGCSLP